jgi:hypothetical protein
MRVFCNQPHPRATLVAWANQGYVGPNGGRGVDPDKVQIQAFANAVQNGTPLYREWSGQTYRWPAGSPILMDLESLNFSTDRSESEIMHWHCKVAAWIKSAYPTVQLMSYTGLRETHLENQKPFIDSQWALCPGGYFGTRLNTNDKQLLLDNERDKILRYRYLYPNKRIFWFSQATFAPAWSDRLAGETDEAYAIRLTTMDVHFADIHSNIAPYCDGVFLWEQEAKVSPSTDKFIRMFNP